MNIYDIAREAGVSIATVSRVINSISAVSGKSVVSEKTRVKVEAVLEKYSYTPDPTARSLVVKKTKSVAILAEDVRNAYCCGVCHASERELCRAGYTAMLCNTGGTVSGIADAIKSALARRADAVIISGMARQANGDIIKAAKSIPVVLINNCIDATGIYSVVCDEIYGMMLAVSHLTGKGRSNIIFVQSGDGNYYGTEKLVEGFDAGMAMNDLSSEGRVFKTETGFDGGFACAAALLREGREFNAVVCDDDATAAGFIKCLRDNFLDVPEDISVVGFHNTIVAQCATPALTTVDCRSDRAGEAAAKLLSGLFAEGHAEKKTVVLPRLVLREST